MGEGLCFIVIVNVCVRFVDLVGINVDKEVCVVMLVVNYNLNVLLVEDNVINVVVV